MPNNEEIEEVLAWGPDEDPAVDHRVRSSDIVPRVLTGLAVFGAVVVVAIGLTNRTPQQASEAGLGQPPPSVAQQMGAQPDGDVLPPCLPGHGHTPCRWDLSLVDDVVIDGWAMPYLTARSASATAGNADTDCPRR
jgi:hypothetical protein